MTESKIGSKIHTSSTFTSICKYKRLCHTALKYTRLSGSIKDIVKKAKKHQKISILGFAITLVPVYLRFLIRYLAKEELRFQNHPVMPRQQSNQTLLAMQVTDPQ